MVGAWKVGELAISVADGWQRQGPGKALLSAPQWRDLGHPGLFGEASKTNRQMTDLARKAGLAFTPWPDWRAVRFDKKPPVIVRLGLQRPIIGRLATSIAANPGLRPSHCHPLTKKVESSLHCDATR